MTLIKHALITIITISAMTIILCGCGKQAEQKIEENDLAMQINQQAFELYQSGSTNDAIKLLGNALHNDSIDENSKQKLFGSLINLHLTCGKPDIAEQKCLESFSEHPEYLNEAANNIMLHYQHNQNTEALLRWCSKLIDMDIPEQLKSNAFYQLLRIYQADEQFDKALDLINQKIHQFPAGIRNNIIQSLAYETIKRGAFDDAEKVLALGNHLFPEDKELQTISLIARIDIRFSSKEWDAGIESIVTAAQQMDDNTLRGVLIRATKQLNNNNQQEKSSDLCRTILTKHKDLNETCRQAAITYINNSEGNPSEELTRLTFLENLKINDAILFLCYKNSFYDILGGRTPDNFLQLKEISEKISASLTNDRDIKHIKTLNLELAFLMEDYERAIELVKSGIEGKDESWASMAISKMHAHQALKNNEPKEAIKHFREFMNIIAEDGESQSDPTTGILHSKEMLLGRNAKRIGDIHLSTNNKEEAAKCYSEAEQYYIDAKLNMDKKHTRSIELIDEESAELIKAKAQLSAG